MRRRVKTRSRAIAPSISSWTLETTGVTGLVPFGTNSQIGNLGSSLGLVDLMSSDLGCQGIRTSMHWRDTETSIGVFSVLGGFGSGTSGRTMASAMARGSSLGMAMRICNINEGEPSGYGDGNLLNGGSAEISAFATNASYVATQLGSNVTHYEILNEKELSMSGPNYKLLLDAVYPAIKAANPSAVVVAGATSGVTSGSGTWDEPGITTVMDAMSVHQYGPSSSTYPPENYVSGILNGMASMWSTMGVASFPYLVTESGWMTQVWTDAVILKFVSRYLFMLRALPSLSGYMQYQQLNEGANEWGLGGPAFATIKIQGRAYKDCADHVHWCTSAKRYSDPNNLLNRAVVMSNGTTRRLAVWTTDTTNVVTIYVTAASPGTLTIQTITGTAGGSLDTSNSLVTGNNAISVTLTDTAQILYANVNVTFAQCA